MVLALDLIPELIFKRDLNADQVVEALAQFTERWLLLEFFPWEDPEVRRFHPEENPFFPRGFYGWYSLDGFTRALALHFATIESMPSATKGRLEGEGSDLTGSSGTRRSEGSTCSDAPPPRGAYPRPCRPILRISTRPPQPCRARRRLRRLGGSRAPDRSVGAADAAGF
jgi:hypothetical protein